MCSLTNLLAAYSRQGGIEVLVLVPHDISEHITKIILKENRKHFWNPRNFWGQESMFSVQPNPEQPKGLGGVWILGAVRDITDDKW